MSIVWGKFLGGSGHEVVPHRRGSLHGTSSRLNQGSWTVSEDS
jgi:hypothetical protein